MDERIERRRFLRTAAGAAAAVGVGAACAPEAAETQSGEGVISGPSINWRLATSFPQSLDILHGGAERFAERIRTLTEGRFNIRVYAAGELVPGLQVMDGVQAGTVQAGMTPGYYYIGKSPALAFDAAVPFGLNTRQQDAWFYEGGGIEIMREVYADFGIINFPMGSTGAQMGGWFRKEVNGLSDMRGLRMRIPGIGGEIMSRLGVEVQVLAGGDIFPALERGAIDATEWVGPYDDEKLGFYEIAPYYYLPGWWEPGVTNSLLVNQEAWDELPETYQEMVATVARETKQDMLARYDTQNPKALKRLVDEGVTLRAFSVDILDAAWNETNDYLEEIAAGDATFKKVYDHVNAFKQEAFPFFAGNELHYAAYAFPKIPGLAVEGPKPPYLGG
jgi:TRAP-type mannitol/chloroaromatic compound transport system substrate-binding protein